MSFNKVNQTTGELTRIAGNGDIPIDSTPTQGSNHAVQSGGTFSAIKNVSDDVDEVSSQIQTLTNQADDMNNVLGAKNVLPVISSTQTEYNGVTITNYSNGTYLLNGTCTADASFSLHGVTESDFLAKVGKASYVLSGYPSISGNTGRIVFQYRKADDSGWAEAYTDNGQGVTLPYDGTKTKYTIYLLIKSGDSFSNVTFKPMIRLASITDDTYVPYSRTNQELTGEVEPMLNVLGAKNLLLNNAVSQTINGVTFTANADGTVTVNGTATVDTYYEVKYRGFKLPNKSLILSGCPSGGSALTYNLHVRSAEADSSQWQYYIDYGDSTSFVADNNRVYVCNIGVMQGQTVSNLIFKPMIRLASIQDDTYVPYSMTNRELTPYVQAISNPNLLDNPWFTVNQRGQSSYTRADAYTVDRWELRRTATTCTLSITDDGVIISAPEATNKTVFICQYLEESFVKSLNGKAITMSVLKDDGTVVKGTVASFDYQTTVQFFNKNGFEFDYEAYNNKYDFRIMNWSQSDIAIRAVKLELGSVSTLAMDTAPDYATELLKCQRYFQRYASKSSQSAAYLGMYYRDSIGANVVIDLPANMRTTPTITLTSALNVEIASGSKKISAIGVVTPNEACNKLKLTSLTIDSQPAGTVGIVTLAGNNYIDLSADL